MGCIETDCFEACLGCQIKRTPRTHLDCLDEKCFFPEANHITICKQRGVSVWWLKYLVECTEEIKRSVIFKFLVHPKNNLLTKKNSSPKMYKISPMHDSKNWQEKWQNPTWQFVVLLFSSRLMQNNSEKPLARKKNVITDVLIWKATERKYKMAN